MDNYYVESPVFRVDLGNTTERRVRGLVVVTWQGKGQGKIRSNKTQRKTRKRPSWMPNVAH